MIKDSRSFESQLIEAVRAINKALGGSLYPSASAGKTEFNQYEVQLVAAVRAIARTITASGLPSGQGNGQDEETPGYIGTTQVQGNPVSQALTGITSIDASGLATIDGGVKLPGTMKIWFGDTYYLELDQYGLHTNAGFYSDQWVSEEGPGTPDAGGVPGDVGLDNLVRMVDGGVFEFEQGELTSTGANTSNGSYIRSAGAFAPPYCLTVPDGYIITQVCYYTAWEGPSDYTFVTRQTPASQHHVLLQEYPLVRIVVARTTPAPMSVSEFTDKLHLVSAKLVPTLPLALKSGYNYNTDNGTLLEVSGTCVTDIMPYIADAYTNVRSLGITCNALFWSDGTYLGWSNTSVLGPTEWEYYDHTLPVTNIAFGLYDIPQEDVYYKGRDPEVRDACEETLADAEEVFKKADFGRTVRANSVFNDQTGAVIALQGYSRSDVLPFIPGGKTDAMDKEAGSCETLYWSDGVYLGYTQNLPYQETPATWIASDHTLPVTHVAFCWNTAGIESVYYIADSGVFADASYVTGKVADLKTYVDTQDATLQAQIDAMSDDLGDVQDAVSTLQGDVAQMGQDIETLQEAIEDIGGDVPAGAISGDNVFTGNNTFTHPVTGVSGTGANNFAVLSQLWNANDSNRWVNAKDYGFLPTNTATANATALNACLQGGNKQVVVTVPGTYKVSATILLYDNTTVVFGAGVVIQKDAYQQNMFRNAGATSRSYNRNITLVNLVISVNRYRADNQVDSEIFGLRGELGFLCTENLVISGFKCEDLYDAAYAIQVNQSYNVLIENFVIRGLKDGVHISSVDTFVIRNGVVKTNDDALAFNACDWVSSNCVDGDIVNGLVENITDEKPESASPGYSCRLLVGAWVDWSLGMSIRRGDCVVNNNRLYRAYTAQPTETVFTSATEPTITTFTGKQADSGGFYWKLMRDDRVYYSCNIRNVEFRNIKFLSKRYGFVEEVDTDDPYNRSLHPSVQYANYPRVEISVRDYYFDESGYEPFSQSANTHTYTRVDGMTGRGATIYIAPPADASMLKRVDASHVDFRLRSSVSAKIRTGANTELHLRDCVDSQAIPVSSTGSIVTDCNIANLPTGPVKGDRVVHNQVPKIYNGTSWVSLI